MIAENKIPVKPMDKSDKPSESLNLNFSYFPAYAKFLLENKVNEFVSAQLLFSREIKLPLLKFFDNFSDEQLLSLGVKNTTALLSYCAANKADKYIHTSVENWVNDQLPFITRNQIVTDDFTKLNFIRRRLFRQFLTSYTNDTETALNIMNEVDLFTMHFDSILFKAFIESQQQLFKQVQSLSRVGNWQWDLKSKKLSWSDEIYAIYELEPQSPIDFNQIAAYNHPDDAGVIDQEMQMSLDTLKPHDFFYRIILGDGRQKTLHAKGEVKLDAKRVSIEMFGTLQDVTDQKQRQKELEESRMLTDKIANVSPCIITAYSVTSGKYLFVNNAVKTFLGYSPEEFLKKGRGLFYELLHPDDVKSVKENHAAVISEADKQTNEAAEQIADLKYRLKNKDGSYRWMHTFTTVFTRNENNKVESMLNVSVDVTESHILAMELAAVNEKVRQKELLHQRMINEVEDYAILMMDKDGFIQNWNKGAEKIKGYSASEIIGKNFRLFYRKEDRDRKLPESLIEEATLKGKASHEGWRVRKDGTTFWGNIVITALHDEDNNVIGFTKVTRNLTERKIAEDTLKEYAARIEQHNEELQRINKDLDSFTYMASHDLQEPLRKIKTFCNIIVSKGKERLPVEISGYFERIIMSVTRMQTLIDSLLHYSRATTSEIIMVPTDLNTVIEEIKKDLAETIADRKVTIKCSKLPVLRIEPLQFHQLFYNLIENAIKYSRTDVVSKITITSGHIYEKENGITSIYHRITVNDNGIGFEQKYAQNIFKPFQRLHGRNEYSGTGIGLAICKKIVENHKGTITATGKPGKGSTFIIELPAEED
jgi:PAS domain S-box-containing protein